MTVYYVGPGGSDGAAGTSWALRKLTLSGAEAIPVVAGDTVWVGPGVYRELLTCGVSGSVGSPITYIGDVSGANTDGVGGTVRITGSNDDLTATRANCITATARNYRTFRGFSFDTTTAALINILTTSSNWIIEDFYMHAFGPNLVSVVPGASGTTNVFRRGVAMGARTYGWYFSNPSVIDNAGHLIENVLFVGFTAAACVSTLRIGGITVRNCTFMCCSGGVRIQTAITVGQSVLVNNCLFVNCGTALTGLTLGDVVEDYNLFWGNVTDRATVNTGTHSVVAPPLFAVPPLLNGFALPAPSLGALGEWSSVRDSLDSGAAADDLYGMTRPATSGKRSWGALQWADQARSVTQAHAGTQSLKLADAGRVQMLVPITNVSTTISVWVWREASYAGTNPQLVVKQDGQTTQTATDAAAAAQWNQLSITLTPAAAPGWVVAELVSNNTAAPGAVAAYFDDLVAA